MRCGGSVVITRLRQKSTTALCFVPAFYYYYLLLILPLQDVRSKRNDASAPSKAGLRTQGDGSVSYCCGKSFTPSMLRRV